MNYSAAAVSELFLHAGAAFSRLAEQATLALETAEDSSGRLKWTNAELRMLRDCVAKHGPSNLSAIAETLRTKSVHQIKAQIRRSHLVTTASAPKRKAAPTAAAATGSKRRLFKEEATEGDGDEAVNEKAAEGGIERPGEIGKARAALPTQLEMDAKSELTDNISHEGLEEEDDDNDVDEELEEEEEEDDDEEEAEDREELDDEDAEEDEDDLEGVDEVDLAGKSEAKQQAADEDAGNVGAQNKGGDEHPDVGEGEEQQLEEEDEEASRASGVELQVTPAPPPPPLAGVDADLEEANTEEEEDKADEGEEEVEGIGDSANGGQMKDCS